MDPHNPAIRSRVLLITVDAKMNCATPQRLKYVGCWLMPEKPLLRSFSKVVGNQTYRRCKIVKCKEEPARFRGSLLFICSNPVETFLDVNTSCHPYILSSVYPVHAYILYMLISCKAAMCPCSVECCLKHMPSRLLFL